jgi:hypothetical protein
MEYHGIDLQGEVYVNSVASLPAWNAGYERRLIYVSTEDTLFIGSNSKWEPVNFVRSGDEPNVPRAGMIWNTTANDVKIRNQANTSWVVFPFPAETKMYFYQNTAPIGWSIVSVTDKLLAVKGGSAAYNTTGGSTAGTWTQPSHVHATQGHVLTIAEMPSHNHTGTTSTGGAHTHDVRVYPADPPQYRTGINLSSYLSSSPSSVSNAALSDGAHNHTFTTSSKGSGSSHSHGNTGGSATASTWRPYAAVGIIAEKD